MEQKFRGRPFKMESWLPALKQVLENEDILFLLDNDLRILTNQLLPEENQISERTFKNWKAGKYHENEEHGEQFLKLIEMALIKQKQTIGKKMLETENQSWVKYAWLLERKFSEWNLKHISENINKNEQSNTILITAGNESQRQLIDQIINSDFEEIKPKRISSNDNQIEEYDF